MSGFLECGVTVCSQCPPGTQCKAVAWVNSVREEAKASPFYVPLAALPPLPTRPVAKPIIGREKPEKVERQAPAPAVTSSISTSSAFDLGALINEAVRNQS